MRLYFDTLKFFYFFMRDFLRTYCIFWGMDVGVETEILIHQYSKHPLNFTSIGTRLKLPNDKISYF